MIEAALELCASRGLRRASWLKAMEYARIDPAIIVHAGQGSTMTAAKSSGGDQCNGIKSFSIVLYLRSYSRWPRVM
jgi:hypothetical protein